MNVAPFESDTERAIAELFEEVLDLTELDRDRSFLDYGGDSLSAMLVISRVRKLFGVEIDLYDFFADDSSVKGISRLIDSLKEESDPQQ